MTLTLSNQRPAMLNPIYSTPVAGPFDPVSVMRKAVVDPVFVPLGTGQVSLLDRRGNQVGADQVAAMITEVLGDDMNASVEDELRHLMGQALVSFNATTPLPFNSVYAVQAATMQRPPLPHPKTAALYTAATDVIPAAKKLLAGTSGPEELLACLSYTYAPATLGFWFQSEAGFEEFKAWTAAQAQTLAPALPPETNQMLAKLSGLKLNALTEGLVLRKDVNDSNGEYSFARVLIHLLMEYARAQQASGSPVMGALPFHAGELFIPTTVVFVNVEIHARSSAVKVDNEWRLINATLASGVKVVSTSSLSRLTALPRAAAKAAAAAANAASNKMSPKGRAASIRFRRRPPTKVDLYKGIIRVLGRMKEVARSHNAYKTVSTSFMKASRRDPSDYNRPGKITKTRFLPDMHLYLDCSGSISETNYQDAAIMMIRLAKKMNVNLYFSSFSTQLSQEVLLKTANKSVNQIWQEFRRIPKVSGGTSYDQIWRYIEDSEDRKKRFSMILTDFEWTPPSAVVAHPKNLYYAPISGSDWNRMMKWAKYYARNMRHIEPAIAQRLIGMTV